MNRIAKPIPAMRYEVKEKPNADGNYYKEKGYDDIEIPVTFNFKSRSVESFDKEMRNIKRWLFSKRNNHLIFSDDSEVFYKVKKVVIETPERIIKRIGRFKVIFTCDPYTYFSYGLDKIHIQDKLYNMDLESKPIYKITGEGLFLFALNGMSFRVQVGQNLTIDTELKLCYREDGTLRNIDFTGKYEDLYLKEGENTFTISDGFKMEIIPNWRCL